MKARIDYAFSDPFRDDLVPLYRTTAATMFGISPAAAQITGHALADFVIARAAPGVEAASRWPLSTVAALGMPARASSNIATAEQICPEVQNPH